MSRNFWESLDSTELYWISMEGRVFSRKSNRLLKGAVNSKGYLTVNIPLKGQPKTKHYVHRLVAEHFIERPRSYDQVNHKDGNKLNNRMSNLEWCTSSQNIWHSVETGLSNSRGEDNYQTNLKESDVRLIRETPFEDIKAKKELAKTHGVTVHCINNIIKRRSWKWLK